MPDTANHVIQDNRLKDLQKDTDDSGSADQIRSDAASRADLGPVQSAPEQTADTRPARSHLDHPVSNRLAALAALCTADVLCCNNGYVAKEAPLMSPWWPPVAWDHLCCWSNL